MQIQYLNLRAEKIAGRPSVMRVPEDWTRRSLPSRCVAVFAAGFEGVEFSFAVNWAVWSCSDTSFSSSQGRKPRGGWWGGQFSLEG